MIDKSNVRELILTNLMLWFLGWTTLMHSCVEQCTAARKKPADWVSTCEDHENVMNTTVSTSAEPAPPKSNQDGGTTPEPQMERHTIKS